MPDSSEVTDRRPPPAVLRFLNPVMRALLVSPLGRAMKDFGVLRYKGRRTGRPYAVVVGVYELDGAPVVFTPAPWRVNFRGGLPLELRNGGRTTQGTGELVEDPQLVAAALQQVFDRGVSDSRLGLKVQRGHRITPVDVRANGRTLIRITPND